MLTVTPLVIMEDVRGKMEDGLKNADNCSLFGWKM
jgi:hypothetical protein